MFFQPFADFLQDNKHMFSNKVFNRPGRSQGLTQWSFVKKSDTTVGWTKNTQKPEFSEKQKKKIIQNGKAQKCLEIWQN